MTLLAYPFPRKYRLVEYERIFLADARDIALQEAFSIGRRATARDYVDLALFTDEGEHLFSTKAFLQQLVYTEDLKDKDAVVRLLHVPYDQEERALDVSAFRKGVDHVWRTPLQTNFSEQTFP